MNVFGRNAALALSDATTRLGRIMRRNPRKAASPDSMERLRKALEICAIALQDLGEIWSRLSSRADYESSDHISAAASAFCVSAMKFLHPACERCQAPGDDAVASGMDTCEMGACVVSLWRNYVRFCAIRYEPVADAVWRCAYPFVASQASATGRDRAHQVEAMTAMLLCSMDLSSMSRDAIFLADSQLEVALLNQIESANTSSVGDRRALLFLPKSCRPTGMANEDVAEPVGLHFHGHRGLVLVAPKEVGTHFWSATDVPVQACSTADGVEVFFSYGGNATLKAERRYRAGIFVPGDGGFRCGLVCHTDSAAEGTLTCRVGDRSPRLSPGQLLGFRRVGTGESPLILGKVLAVRVVEKAIHIRFSWMGSAMLTEFTVVGGARRGDTLRRGFALSEPLRGVGEIRDPAPAKPVVVVSKGACGDSGRARIPPHQEECNYIIITNSDFDVLIGKD